MNELTDGATGELRRSPAETAVLSMLAIPDGLTGVPMAGPEIDQMLVELADLLSHVGRVVTLLYEDKHRAEEAYEGALSDYMVANAKYGPQMARRIAMSHTKTELHDVNLAKEKLRYAEEMQKSLQNRSYGLMNIGKRFTAAVGLR